METQNDVVTIDLKKVWYLIKKNIVVLIAITLVCAALGYCLSAFVMKPTFSASADMLVNNNSDKTQLNSISSADISASTSLVDTYSVILKSHTILEQVTKDLNLDYDYDTLSDMITVSAVDTTSVMRIEVRSKDSKEALAIVKDIVRLAPNAIIDTVEAGSVKTVDKPWTTGERVAPSHAKYTAIFGLLGLILTAAIILIRDLLDNTFKTEDDIKEILNLPVLGVIPLESYDKGGK